MAPSTVLLIGAGNIGGEVVRQLQAKGYKVYTGGIDAGVDFKCDMKDLKSILALGPAIPDGVDHVVICAGHSTFGNITKFTAASWYDNFENKMLSVSRTAMLLLNGEELKLVRDGGSITITSGLAARTTNKNWPAIAANCAGLDAFVRCAGQEPPRGVRLNAVAPTTVKETAEAAGQPSENCWPRARVAAMYVDSVLGTMSGEIFLGGDPGAPKAFGEEVFNHLHKGVAATAAGYGQSASQRVKVRLASGAGGTFGVDDIAIAHATSGGFWEREGLDVEWIGVRGGVKAAEAVLNEEAVAGYGTWVPCVKKRLEGKPIKILASMAQALAQNLIVDRSKITCPDDLRGKKWAVDGIGALSHTLGQLIVRGLGIPDGEVEWVVAGPPPQRIEQLLNGSADCSLVRVEEAAVLARQHPDKLARLLGFEEIFPLAPVQPHGILSVTETFAREQPEICAKLLRGLVMASRDLHDNLESFREVVRINVTERPAAVGPRVEVSDEEVKIIWEREVAAGSFAVNGGLSTAHWARGLQMYGSLNQGAGASLTLEEIALPQLAANALGNLGKPHAALHDVPDADGSKWTKPLVELAGK